MPILKGLLRGFLYAAASLTVCGMISLLLIGFDLFNGMGGDKNGGLSLLIPFCFGPLIFIAGAPWSFLAFKIHSSTFQIVMTVAGVILNGGLVGAFWGAYKWFRGR